MKNVVGNPNEPLEEWRQYYLSTQMANKMLQIKRHCSEIVGVLKIKQNQIGKLDVTGQILIFKENVKNDKQIKILQLMKRANLQIKQIDKMFIESIERQEQICRIFIQFTLFDLHLRGDRCLQYFKQVELQDEDLITLAENIYIEFYYVQQKLKINFQTLQNLKNQYSDCLDKNFNIYITRLKRTYNNIQQNNQKIEQLERILTGNNKKKVNQSQIKESSQNLKESQSYNFKESLGLISHKTSDLKYILLLCVWCGLLLTILGVLAWFKEIKVKGTQAASSFEADLPIWRGAAIMIFYSWTLGFVFYLLNCFNFNYRLVLLKCFEMDTKYLSPNWLIIVTSLVFLSVYTLMFGLYMLEATDMIQTAFRFHQGGIVWLVILGYLFLPLPILNYKIRFNILKQLFLTVIVLFIRAPHKYIFLTEQAVSLGQLYPDLAFVICKHHDPQSKCTEVPLIGSILIGIAFIYRIISNLKFASLIKIGYFSGPYMGAARAFLALNAVIAGYVHRVYNTTASQTYWIVLVACTAVLAWYVDVKFDWGLFSWERSSRLTRPHLCLRKSQWVYYVLIVSGLLLRITWVFSLFPIIISKLSLFTNQFLIIIAFLEIFRRAIWNFFRIQFQQSKLKSPFLDESKLQDKIDQRYFEKKGIRLLGQVQKDQRIQVAKAFQERLKDLLQQRKNSIPQVQNTLKNVRQNIKKIQLELRQFDQKRVNI